MKLATRWRIQLILVVVPFTVPLIGGFIWLWQTHTLLLWSTFTSIAVLTAWRLNRWRTDHAAKPRSLEIDPSGRWSARGIEAWGKIEAISKRIQEQEPDISSTVFYADTLKEVLQTVAQVFHPEQNNAMLEMRVPYLLKGVELLARDLRIAFSDHVPGSHILTINDIVRGHRLAEQGRELFQLYRIVAAGVDPVSRVIRESRTVASTKLWTDSTQEIKRWLLDAYIKKIGFYAVELYSGHLVLDEAAFDQYTTKASRRQIEQAQKQERMLQQEPLRVLVLGQTNAGKSSLINALFGECKADTDVLPKTDGITPYVLEREGLSRAIILDTAGYENVDQPQKALHAAAKEVVKSDLILMVISARNAARAADKQVLTQLLTDFTAQTGEKPPPVILVLSCIDQLKPVRQWNPPYNILNPVSSKARAIRSAMETVAEALGVDIDRVAPVSLKAGQEYNVEESLIPTILQSLDQAKRLKYLRCVADYKKIEYWKQLWQQSKSAGKFIARKTFSGR